MTLPEFASLIRDLRKAQHTYRLYRTEPNLTAVKVLERRVNLILREIAPPRQQTGCFPDEGTT